MRRSVSRGEQKEAFNSVFPPHPLIAEVADWAKRAIGRQVLLTKNLKLVSAVCPDYEFRDGGFTYRSMGKSLPHNAEQHLRLIEDLLPSIRASGVGVEYYVTLADTEFDLPLVVKHLAQNDRDLFLRLCQESCEVILESCRKRNLPVVWVKRFTQAFPDWFEHYERGLGLIREELEQDPSLHSNLHSSAVYRMPLYRAMANWINIDEKYCEDMVVRQWAQYMAWGECAEKCFGAEFIMINHTTPNLTRVNHPAFRGNRDRIPIVRLGIDTMPKTAVE